MDKRKIGATILVISILLGFIVISLIGNTQGSGSESGCFQDEECNSLAFVLNISLTLSLAARASCILLYKLDNLFIGV